MSSSINSQTEGWIIKTLQNCIEKPRSQKYETVEEVSKKLFDTIRLPFTTCSREFYDFLKENNKIISETLLGVDLELFVLIESYLRDKNPDSLEEMESYLKSVRENDFDACGINLLRSLLADGAIIRNAYRSGDQDIIQLFKKYLPRPSVDLFERDGGLTPDCIIEEAHQAATTIKTLTQAQGRETLERSTIAIQRRVRGSQRSKKELRRVMKIEQCDENEAKLRIRSGNRPYIPRYKDRNLALRIFNAAFLVPNHPTMSHVTAASSLPKILDDCLYGRKTILARYLAFRPAQLFASDQNNGDTDAICFAPQEIDESAWRANSVEIILDMEKFRAKPMEKRNPCLFFKQQDLGYRPDKIRKVWISQKASIEFNHTTHLRCQPSRHSGFLLNPYDSGYALLPFQKLISSNFESMTAIQTLNFFKYLDALTASDRRTKVDAIDRIYDQIAQLDDKELVEFLTQLHNKSTDTAEFNFYGAYKIDLELIQTIHYFPYAGRYPINQTSVNLPELIDRLNEGDFTLYHELQQKMPFLFESSRFVNFLHSKIKNKEALDEEKVP